MSAVSPEATGNNALTEPPAAAAVRSPRISFSHMTKRFGGTVALDDVSFDIQPGRVHALVGENGAGKSTLMKILAGALAPTAGTMLLDGSEFAPSDPRDAMRRGIAIVYQELSLVPHLSVAENIYLGRWPQTFLGAVHRRALQRQSRDLCDRLHLELPLGAAAGSLSVAQQQLVEIARALSLDASLLVLDEPSAVLSPSEVGSLFRFVRNLIANDVSVVYISHRLDEIFELADDVTVLRDGAHVSTRPVREVTHDLLIRETVGRELTVQFPQRAADIGAVVLKMEHLSSRRRFDGVSLDVRAGEILGITGLVGSGRSSMARALFGAAPVTAGSFSVGTTRGPFRDPGHAKRSGVVMVPEDRKHDGLMLQRTLRENLTLAHLDDVSTAGILRPARERATAQRMVDAYRILSAGLNAPMDSHSGGNQQKALIARWLSRPCRLVILDEPTRGVDVGAKAEIYAMINGIAAAGAAVLMISSELPEIIGMCDRVAVMCEGRMTGMLDNCNRAITQEAIMRLAVRGAVA
jgi:ABC-type sugar transport system ATPase subunit